VLRREVAAWSRITAELGEGFRQDLVSFAQAELPREIEERIGRASFPELERWRRRLGYVCDLAAIFDPSWKPPLELVTHSDLLRAAFGEPIRRWAIVLSLSPSRRADKDRALVETMVPWFSELRQAALTLCELKRYGVAVLTAIDRVPAHRLFYSIRTRRPGRFSSRLIQYEGGEETR
jgi:hypothetical protein